MLDYRRQAITQVLAAHSFTVYMEITFFRLSRLNTTPKDIKLIQCNSMDEELYNILSDQTDFQIVSTS